MLTEDALTARLRTIEPQAVHGYYNRFVELRHLMTDDGRGTLSNAKPLWGLGSKRYGGRFTPREAFETVYFAEDPVTAMIEVTSPFQVDQRPLPLFVQPPWVLITIDAIILRVLDVTRPDVQHTLCTNEQELTGAWRHIQATELEAPTQTLGRVCYESSRFEGIRFPSCKNRPDGICLAVFIDRMKFPSVLKVFDPYHRLVQTLP